MNNGSFRLPKMVQVFCLRSVNLLRKYSLVFDVPMSFLLAHTAYVASLSDWWTIQKAMACHHSQYVWFRKAYMLFSRDTLCKSFYNLAKANLFFSGIMVMDPNCHVKHEMPGATAISNDMRPSQVRRNQHLRQAQRSQQVVVLCGLDHSCLDVMKICDVIRGQ